MRIKMVLKKIIKKFHSRSNDDRGYYKRYIKYSFKDTDCKSAEQYEGVITRLYHTIEKGLSYENYRPGFGKENINKLLSSLEEYAKEGYDIDAFFYRTALSCLNSYIERNKEFGYVDEYVNNSYEKLPGKKNDDGGSFWYFPSSEEKVKTLSFKELLEDRHSIRHFSGDPVDIDKIKSVLELSQHTPSACNRQGWKCRIVSEKDRIDAILKNHNGTNGFGQEFDKILVITGDLRYFNRSRETYQVFVDGGLYAANVINALHYYHIGSIPLSASVTKEQEKNLRDILKMHEAEVLILFIGIGDYPEKVLTAKSTRHEPRMLML